MKKALKIAGFLCATFLLLVLVAVFAAYHFLQLGEFRRFLVAELEEQTQAKVKLGAAGFDIGWITGVTFQDLALAESESAEPLITAAQITARLALIPLVQGKFVIYEVRLLRPAVRLTRAIDGSMPLFDRLLNLPFIKERNEQFSLDLRRVTILSGRVDYRDENPSRRPDQLSLSHVELVLERLRGERFRQIMADLLKLRQITPKGEALQYAFKGEIGARGARSNIEASGKVVFPEGTFEWQQAWWLSDLRMSETPLAALKAFGIPGLGAGSLDARWVPQLRIQGVFADELQINGSIDFKQLTVAVPKEFGALVPLGDGQAQLEAQWKTERLLINRLKLRTKDLRLSAKGELLGFNTVPRINLGAAVEPLNIKTVRRFIAGSPESSTIRKYLNAIDQGELSIKRIQLNGTIAEFQNLTLATVGERITVEGELRNVQGRIAAIGAIPLLGWQGRLSFSKNQLGVENLSGRLGDSKVTRVQGSYLIDAGNDPAYRFQADGDLNLAELKEKLDWRQFPKEAANFVDQLEGLTGRAMIGLSWSRQPQQPVEFKGRLDLTDTKVTLGAFRLSQLSGPLRFTTQEIAGDKMQATLAGSPVVLGLVVKDYRNSGGTFDLRVTSPGVRAGILTPLLFTAGNEKDPGKVGGEIRYSGSLQNKKNRNLTGNLVLEDAQIATKPLLQPLRQLDGKVQLDENGIDLRDMKGLLVGAPMNFNARWRYNGSPQLTFNFNAPYLDVLYLHSQIDPEDSEFYAHLRADGKISLNRGRLDSFEFGALKSDVTIDRRLWRFSDLDIQAGGGSVRGTAAMDDRSEIVGFTANPRISKVPVQSFLRWFDVRTSEITGNLGLDGRFETRGASGAQLKKSLNGDFKLNIADGTIHRMRILVQILNLLDLSRWFTLQLPDLAKQGIRFRSITGDFTVMQGVFHTENLLVDSDDLRMTGAGKIDIPAGQIEFVVAVRPFAGIDSAIGKIPILGRGIAAIRNSFMVASFNITGAIDDPTITPAPLSTISEVLLGVLGIPKSVLGGSDEKQ